MNNRMEFRELGLILLFLAGVSSDTRCSFPTAWHGSYFHLGYSSSLLVSNQSITEKGECIWNSGSQYVLQTIDGGEKCWRCLSIYRKHQNVLQYKESYCETYFDGFSSLCSGIAGDSAMYSMIRRDVEPEPCPFHGPHTFSYAKGGAGAVCGYPESYLDSCSDKRSIQLSFQACIDVQGSEISSEKLTCLAGWKEGSKHYLVGELSRQHIYTDEQKYRCFVYEYHGKGATRAIRMAESMSATCMGLWSPVEGFRTYEIQRVEPPEQDCRFPDWFVNHRTWRSLNSEISIHVHSNHGFKLENFQDKFNPEKSFLSCHSLVGSDTLTTRVVTYVKSKCDSGFVCTEITKTSDGVISARFGPKARNPIEACSQLYFTYSVIKSFLLVSNQTPVQTCSLSGRYQLEMVGVPGVPGVPEVPGVSILSDCSTPTSLHLTAGCGSSSLTVESECEPGNITRTSYTCHSHWTQDGRSNLILRREDSISTICLSSADKLLHVGDIGCGLEAPVYSISETGPCLQALSSQPTSSAPVHGFSSLLFITVLYLSNPIAKYGY